MPDPVQSPAMHGVDLWRVRVDRQAHAHARHWAQLDAGERRRASGYRHEADRLRYVISRGTLRALLGRLLQIEPASVAFGSGEFGKPFVAAHHGLHFNTSHSGDWVLHAFSSDVPLGVDVQALPPEPLDLEDFRRVLAAPELDRLRSLPMAQRRAVFVDLWVCKEAYVKAIGQGLNRTLRDICIAPLERGGYALLDDCDPGAGRGAWTLAMIDLGPAHAGCLVHPGPPRRLRIHDYAGDPDAGDGRAPSVAVERMPVLHTTAKCAE